MTEDASAGRLHADVVADLSGFRRDLEAKLKAALSGVRARVRAEIDTTGMAAQARAAAQRATASVRVKLRAEIDARGLATQVRKAAAEAGRAATARIRAEADVAQIRAELERKVAQAARGIRAQIGVRVDAKQVRAQLAAIRGGTITVDVRLDTRKARAELERLRQQAQRDPVKSKVELDAGQAFVALGRVLRSASLIPAVVSGIAVATGLVGNLAAALFSVSAAASQAAGTLAILPGLVGAAAQGLGALVIGFLGIGDAVKALDKAQEASASTAARAASQQVRAAEQIQAARERLARAEEDAAERVADARRNLARVEERTAEQILGAQQRLSDVRERAAERLAAAEQRLTDIRVNGAERVREAERRVTSAHLEVTRAQEDLNRAIADAVDRFEDLELAIRGAALDEQDALIAVERARRRLEAIRSPYSLATDLERAQAQVDYEQALLRLDEIAERRQDLAQEKAEADRTGIDGSREVVRAQDRLNKAVSDAAEEEYELGLIREKLTRDIAEAQADLARVQRDNTRDIADAEADLQRARRDGARAVADAQRDLQRAQRDAARSVADAQRALQQALRAGEQAAGGQSAALNALNSALGKLSPAGQRFAKFLQSTLIPRLRRLQWAVQEALLPPLQTAITRAMPLLDTIQTGLVDTGRRLGELALRGADLAASPAFRSDVGRIMASNNRAITDFGQAGLHLADALRHLAVVAGPILLEPFARWTRQLAKTLSVQTEAARRSGDLARWLTKARDTGKTLSAIVRDLTGALFNLGKAALPSGDSLLKDLAAWAADLRKTTADPNFQKSAQEFFAKAIPVAKHLASLAGQFLELIIKLADATGGDALQGFFTVLEWAVNLLEKIVSMPGAGPVLSAILILAGAGFGLSLVARALGGIVLNLGKLAKYSGLSKLVGALAGTKAGQAVKGAASKAAGAAKSKAGNLIGSVASGAAELAGGLASKAGGAVKKGAQRAGGAVKKGAQRAGGAVRSGLGKARDAVARRVAGRGAEKGAASVAGALGGQAIAAGLSKAASAARTAASAVAGYVVQLGKAGASAIVTGISRGAQAIGTVAAAAGRGVVALAGLAAAHARTALAATLAGAKTLAWNTIQGVARIATVAWTTATYALGAAMRFMTGPIGAIIAVIGLLVGAVVWAYNNVDWFRDGVDAVFRAVAAVGKWLWNSVLKPVFTFIGEKAVWLYKDVFLPQFENIKRVIGVVATAARWFYDSVIKPVMSLVGGVIKTVVGLIIGNFDLVKRGLSQIGSAWNTIWTGIRNFLSNTYNTYIRPVFTKLSDFITKTIPNAFATGVAAIKKFWDKLVEVAKKPVSFVVNTIYNSGIRRVWNWIADKVGLGQLPELQGFATGGVFPGYTPGRDVGLAAVSGGEAIMRPEWTRAVGPAFVHWMNRLARTGGVGAVRRAMGAITGAFTGAFARGGVVPPPGVPFSGYFDVGGIISRFFHAAKGYFANGLKVALSGVMDPLIRVTNEAIGDTGIGRLIAAIPRSIRDNLIGFLTRFADQLEGGDALGVVAAARKYLGIGDDRGRDNDNPFTRLWGWPAGTPWCALFVSTAIKDAKAEKSYPGYPSAAVASYVGAMKHVGIGEGRPGDLAAYRGTGHVNIIEEKVAGGYRTIGGNEGPLVRRAIHGGQTAILRPGFARGGIVDRIAQIVFGREYRFAADPADRRDPLNALYAGATRLGMRWRDRGGPLPPGLSLVYNGTGGTEWVLSPQAVDVLGGERAVAALNAGASGLYRARDTRTVPAGAGAGAGVKKVVQNIYPQPRQSEQEIGMIAARKIGAMLG